MLKVQDSLSVCSNLNETTSFPHRNDTGSQRLRSLAVSKFRLMLKTNAENKKINDCLKQALMLRTITNA